jgi:DNA repair protein RecN (Recombination protein N)
MLNHLTIKNLAVIDEVALDFTAGFSVLTGETGAGKSILIDAIGLVTGARADPAMVRSGAEKAEISAEFSLADCAAASAWLAEAELADADDADLCVVRRLLYAEGRTRAFVNGHPVNAGQLRELGEALIEIFGQAESQTLLRADTQRLRLDDFGAYPALLDAVAGAAAEVSAIDRNLERLRGAGERDPAQLDYLRFQLQELQALNLQPGEAESLDAEHRQLANAGRLLQDGGAAQERLYGSENSVYDLAAGVSHTLADLVPLSPGFKEALDLCDAAQAQLQEAADAVRRVLERLDLDPERLASLERRMTAVHELARKHRVRPEELGARLDALRGEVDEAEHASERVTALEREREAALARYRAAAMKLGDARRKAAKKLSERVSATVRELGMPAAQFIAVVDSDAKGKPRGSGDDDVRFDFSANPGQPPRPLARVASGGELSRVSLAIQVAGEKTAGAATMIFDEVDAGIGGAVAEIVGQKLRQLAHKRQVLCVTHLAQVAAQGHAHFAIAKEVARGQTYTRVSALRDAKRVEELARMQGGVEITASALSHARELLKRASQG